MIVVNKIDAGDVDFEGLMEEITDAFGKVCLPINLPNADGSAVVDCFFAPKLDAATAFSSVGKAHDAIVDQVVELDENLMNLYLEQGESLNPEQLHDPFEAALRQGSLIPVCFASARTGVGVPELLEVMGRLMPDPTEGNPPQFYKGEGAAAEPVSVSPDPAKHVVAHVFEISNDPYRGKLSIFRVYQGTITPNTQLYIGDARKPIKASHLLRLQGKQQVELTQAIPGDICAVARVDEIHRDAVLHDSHDEDNWHLKPPAFPQAVFGLALVPQRRGDEQKLSDALSRLLDEDPSLAIEHDAQANEMVIRGLGELHLKVILEQLKSRYNVQVDTKLPSVPYRETIIGRGDARYRHKKQTGGAGQFGEVALKVEPLERGGGFEFVDEIKGGAIPGQFLPAVEKGVRQAMSEGAVAGHPIQDVRVRVYDGKHHPVDSKEIAFVTAGRNAMLEAIAQAKPVVLEPIVDVEVRCHADMMGDVNGDISSRRGRVTGSDSLPHGRMAIRAIVPMAEMAGYEGRLKSMTGGDGTYSVAFSHYEPVPGEVQQRLAAEFQKTRKQPEAQ
jgi:elongation factor G